MPRYTALTPMPPKIKLSGKTNTQTKKRKRDELADRSHNKKQKVEDETPNKSVSVSLPEDCWRTILIFLDNLTGPMLVSKQLMKICCQILNTKLASIFDISVKDASLVPNEVKRIASHIDIYVLLEMALDKARSNNNKDGLMEVLQRLHPLVNMQLYCDFKNKTYDKHQSSTKVRFRRFGRTNPDRSYLESVWKRIGNEKILYTEMNLEYIGLWYGDEDETTYWKSNAKFVWFGKNGRFANVKLQFTETESQVEYSRCVDIKFIFDLTELGSEQLKTVEVDIKANLDQGDPEHKGYWARHSCATQNQLYDLIIEWLQLDHDSEHFKYMLHYFVHECKNIPVEAPSQCYHHSLVNKYKGDYWNGRIEEELKRAMVLFTSNERGWASEIELIITVIIAKLKLLDRIRNATKMKKRAQNEFLNRMDQATMEYGFMQDRLYHQSKGKRSSTEGTLLLHMDQFRLNFLKDGKTAATIDISELGGVPSNKDTRQYENYVHALIKFPDTKKTKNDKMRFINELQLKHVTEKDLSEAIKALRAKPGNYE